MSPVFDPSKWSLPVSVVVSMASVVGPLVYLSRKAYDTALTSPRE